MKSFIVLGLLACFLFVNAERSQGKLSNILKGKGGKKVSNKGSKKCACCSGYPAMCGGPVMGSSYGYGGYSGCGGCGCGCGCNCDAPTVYNIQDPTPAPCGYGCPMGSPFPYQAAAPCGYPTPFGPAPCGGGYPYGYQHGFGAPFAHPPYGFHHGFPMRDIKKKGKQ